MICNIQVWMTKKEKTFSFAQEKRKRCGVKCKEGYRLKRKTFYSSSRNKHPQEEREREKICGVGCGK